MSLKIFNFFTIFLLLCCIIIYIIIYNNINLNHYFISDSIQQKISSSNCKSSINIDLLNELYSQILPENIPKFPLYKNSHNSLIPPTWIVTLSNVSTIHRFFDSSPFSPSGRYLGLTQVSKNEEGVKVKFGMVSEIVIIDLYKGSQNIIATTKAWDAQVGAHVQWGNNDNELIFNDIIKTSNNKNPSYKSVGIVMNIFTGQRRELECSIYHVNNHGTYGISPSLDKIKYTQLGYGVHIDSTKRNHNAPDDDGFYLTDIISGKCKILISLKDLVALIPTKKFPNSNKQCSNNASTLIKDSNYYNTPTYGFHSKWSNDGMFLMLIVRTIQLAEGLKGDILNYKIRRQHMFVMKRKGKANWSSPIYVISWSSGRFQPSIKKSDIPERLKSFFKISNTNNIYNDLDGNHPNWIPETSDISMNIQFDNEGNNVKKTWGIIRFDVDKIMNHEGCTYSNILQFNKDDIIFTPGSGHPNFHINGRYLLIDAYAKEKILFSGLLDKSVPIRLVDSLLKKEVWLMQIQIERNDNEISNKKLSKIANSWRCDPHIAWDRSYKWIAFNGRPSGGNRQVLISYLGNDLQKFF